MWEWISVEDRLPIRRYECFETGNLISRSVLITNKNESPSIGVGHVDDNGSWTCYDGEHDFMNVSSVTHWMPLPEPPK